MLVAADSITPVRMLRYGYRSFIRIYASSCGQYYNGQNAQVWLSIIYIYILHRSECSGMVFINHLYVYMLVAADSITRTGENAQVR